MLKKIYNNNVKIYPYNSRWKCLKFTKFLSFFTKKPFHTINPGEISAGIRCVFPICNPAVQISAGVRVTYSGANGKKSAPITPPEIFLKIVKITEIPL